MHHRRRPHPPTRPRHRSTASTAGIGDVQRLLGAGLQPPRPAGGDASHHTRLRQHATHGRARLAASLRAAGQGSSRGPSRQPRQGTAAGCRAAPQARRTLGAGGHRLAGTGHRYRRRGPGLPARLAALDRRVPAARRPLRPCSGRHAEGAPVSRHPRRPGRMHGPARLRAPRRAGRADPAAAAAGRAGATDRRRSGLPGMERGRAVRPGARRPSLSRSHA